MNNFPLLNQINEDVQSDNLDWNKNAFQTLITSNLPSKTIVFFAIHVGLRRLENSLYEPYWDATLDALNDLSQYLFNLSIENQIEDYIYEAKCQLLMYASIAMIKMNTIRRRSTHDAKLVCAMICSLLLQSKKSFENLSIENQYSTCIRSMRFRYLKRIYLIVQWLSTFSSDQFHDLESNYHRYLNSFLEQLFSSVCQREQIHQFIETNLFERNPNEEDVQSNDFVLIRRFPIFHKTLLDEYHELMHLGLTTILLQTKDSIQKLICCIWTLCCMIESDRVSVGILSSNLIREHFSKESIDFEQKSIDINSLNEQDVIIFLLLCALQNVHLNQSDSILHPYLLFSSAHLCTQQQKNWWLTAIDQISSPSNDFLDHLATIRLDDERISQYPPKGILLEIARILFKSALIFYEQNAKQTASAYEQYAIQYFQIAKTMKTCSTDSNNKMEKLFFFYSQKQLSCEDKTIDLCEKLARQYDELKSLPEPESPRTSSPTKSQQKNDLIMSANLSPVVVKHQDPEISDSTLFATPPSNKSRDIEVQTFIQSPPPMPVVIEETPEPTYPSYVDLVFTHMEQVNRWINDFCADHQAMQNEIFTIRDRLETINRVTSQMMYSDRNPSHI